jgi:hypothetical protein
MMTRSLRARLAFRLVLFALPLLWTRGATAQPGHPWPEGFNPEKHLASVAAVQPRGQGGELTLETTTLFAGSGVCASCHSSDGVALVDANFNDIAPPSDWRATMMANSLRDPLFRAKIQSEIARHPNLPAAAIEDKCLTCHAPMARTQAKADGAEFYTLAEAMLSPMALDGVSCTLCHQIMPDNLGTPESYNGHYQIHPTDRDIYGPYFAPVVAPMLAATGFRPVFGAHKQTSEVCATCHTLFVDVVNDQGQTVGSFPEQTPYLEWKNSVYAAGAAEESHCQTCHMPITNDGVKITNTPSFVEPRAPFWKHHFVGGNAFMLGIIRDNGEALGVTASAEQFNTTIERTLSLLRNETIALDIIEASGEETLRVVASVENKTGHKFPTGYSARRAWLRLTATDANGAVFYQSGGWDAEGRILGLDEELPYEPHRDLIATPNQVAIYEGLAGDLAGNVTHSLLSAASFLKDNRLPPRGFVSDGPDIEHTAIRGEAASDPNFNRDPDSGAEGTGRDLVTYDIELNSAPLPITIEVQMVYQSVSPDFADDLFQDNAQPMVGEFQTMYNNADNAPVVMTTVRRVLDNIPVGGWVIR